MGPDCRRRGRLSLHEGALALSLLFEGVGLGRASLIGLELVTGLGGFQTTKRPLCIPPPPAPAHTVDPSKVPPLWVKIGAAAACAQTQLLLGRG